MPGGGNPLLDDLVELFRGHAGMRGHDQFQQRVFTTRQGALHIAAQHRGEWFRSLPLRMLRCHLLDAIEREQRLKIQRLLGP